MTQSEKALRVGLIGLGMMGKNHFRVLSSLEEVELVGVLDPVLTSDVSLLLKDTRQYKDIDDFFSQEMDYCVIATPTSTHKDIAIRALTSGLNCLIEKPIASNYEDAIQIQRQSTNAELLVCVGHIERYNSAVLQLKSRLTSGQLGKVYQISFRRQGPFPSRISDVGVVRDLATHDLDLAMWLTGSKFSNIDGLAHKVLGRPFEDTVSINASLSNQVIVNIQVNWISPIKERSITVIGERGMFTVDTLMSDLTFYEAANREVTQENYQHFKGVKEGSRITYSFDKPEPLLLEHRNFKDKLLGRQASIVSLNEGIEVIKVADAVLESWANGKRVIL